MARHTLLTRLGTLLAGSEVDRSAGESPFRLSLKTLAVRGALTVTVFAATLAAALEIALTRLPPAVILASLFALGLFTYATFQRLLASRLRAAHSLLRDIQNRQFDRLSLAPRPDGDELEALLWQVHRTGLAVQTEMSELRRMEQYRREFIGNVSHELKTPIFTIQGFSETLLNGALTDERVNRDFLGKIHRNACRLDSLARDLSDISRLESGGFRVAEVPFSLRGALRETVEAVEIAAAAKNVVVRCTVHEEAAWVLGDPGRIRQVLVNLVQNAVQYNKDGGWVEITAGRVSGGDVRIAVTDNGIGIAPEDIPRITERFFRVDRSRSRNQGGTGLGLAIVKHILSAHNRTLYIESLLGQGSTLSFTLPAAAPAALDVRLRVGEGHTRAR